MQEAFHLRIGKGSTISAMGDVVQEQKTPESRVVKVQESSTQHENPVPYITSFHQLECEMGQYRGTFL